MKRYQRNIPQQKPIVNRQVEALTPGTLNVVATGLHHLLHSGIASALGAAVLFGATTPLAKLLLDQMHPVMLAGVLYLGSGVGLLAGWSLRRTVASVPPSREAGLDPRDLRWLMGAVVTGGVIGPVLLMVGLTLTPASSASLLLNLEGVLTAALAWFAFHEHFDRRIVWGMVLIAIGGVMLSWDGSPSFTVLAGPLAVVAACLCWAIDNNLTRKISSKDPVLIAGSKGLIAGLVNLGLAQAVGIPLPGALACALAGMLGLIGYGVSLVLFVYALRHVGAARTGAYFSSAPFIGAIVALVLLREAPSAWFWGAAFLMAIGLWLHLTEHHEHEHLHEEVAHTHRHVHDAHHLHEHDVEWEGQATHTHFHVHEPLLHRHPHYPDIHHRHRH